MSYFLLNALAGENWILLISIPKLYLWVHGSCSLHSFCAPRTTAKLAYQFHPKMLAKTFEQFKCITVVEVQTKCLISVAVQAADGLYFAVNCYEVRIGFVA